MRSRRQQPVPRTVDTRGLLDLVAASAGLRPQQLDSEPVDPARLQTVINPTARHLLVNGCPFRPPPAVHDSAVGMPSDASGNVPPGPMNEADIYVTRHGPGPDPRPASTADQDFVAHARQDLPRLLAEVRRLRARAPVDP